MSTLESIHEHDGTKVHYKTRNGAKDRRHLIVMFTGIRPHHEYEFDGASTKDSQANWLWIRDDFDGEHTYYLCQNMDFRIERAVFNLIKSEIDRLGLTSDQVTLAGCSKGGAAAIYFAIKYRFPNVMAGVPQMRVGSYVSEIRPKILAHMTLESSDQERQYLDSLIPNAIETDTLLDRNIYIVSSTDDQEYVSQLKPYLHLYEKYSNFNLILTDSDLVDEHIEVVRYNIPAFLSIMYLLTDGIAPVIGKVTNGGRAVRPASPVHIQRSSVPVPYVDFQSILIANSRIYPKGVSFCEGFAVARYADLKRVLIIANGKAKFTFPLGSLEDKWLTSKYFKDIYCDYRYAKFSSLGQDGIDIRSIPRGIYELEVEMTAHGILASSMGGSSREFSQIAAIGEDLVRIWSNNRGTYLERRSCIGRVPPSVKFTVAKKWSRSDLIHIEGTFAIEGLEVSDWKNFSYFLILRSANKTVIRPMGTGNRPSQIGLFDDGLANYSAAYYATAGYRGVSVHGISDDSYDILISVAHGNSLFTNATGLGVSIVNGSATWVPE